jgi:hypothetical protein
VVAVRLTAACRVRFFFQLCEGLVVSAVALDNVMDVLSAVGRHSDVVKEHCLKFIGTAPRECPSE